MADGWNRQAYAAGLLAASACLALPVALGGCTGQPPLEPGTSSSPAAAGLRGAAPSVTAVPAAPQVSPEGRLVGRRGPRTAPTRALIADYVLPADGGSRGVRFGCNDSLVALPTTGPASGDALASSVSALLASPQAPQATGTALPRLYNALAGSRLTFLSGSFDGTTVTLYLTGSLRPDSPCDAPRIEAQLTQTAVAAVGAIRADIHVNGQSLADALKVK